MGRDIRAEQQRRLSQLSGNPAYFFDREFLLQRLGAKGGWNDSRLEHALTAHFDTALSSADLRIPTDSGCYVIFDNPNHVTARQQAGAICASLTQQFLGMDGAPVETEKLCRASSVKLILDELDPPAPTMPEACDNAQTGAALSEEDRNFAHEIGEIYRSALSSNATQPFRFAPLWDSKHERVTCFACEEADPESDRSQTALDISDATAQCRLDVLGLASATKGVRHISARGELAAVCVTVHVSTLALERTRNGYLSALAAVEPDVRSFLAPRIIGMETAGTWASIPEWTKAITRFTPWSFLHLATLDFEFWRFPSLGVRGIGVSARTLQGAEDDVPQEVTRLGRICARQKSFAYVDKLSSIDEVKAIKGQGIRGISGPVIGPSRELPGPTGSLPFSEIASRRK